MCLKCNQACIVRASPCGQEGFEFQAWALKQNQAFSVNVSGPSSENYNEDGSCVFLALAASVQNYKFQQKQFT